jgi:hypothetical protein
MLGYRGVWYREIGYNGLGFWVWGLAFGVFRMKGYVETQCFASPLLNNASQIPKETRSIASLPENSRKILFKLFYDNHIKQTFFSVALPKNISAFNKPHSAAHEFMRPSFLSIFSSYRS